MRFWLTIIILVFIKLASAQPAYEDSLRAEVVSAKDDSSKIKLWSELSNYFSNNKLDSAVYYSQKVINYSQAQQYKYGEALGFLMLASALDRMGNYPKSLEMILKGKSLAEELKQNKAFLLRRVYNQLGLLDRLTNQYESGIVNFLQALSVSEQSGKSDDNYFRVLSNLGLCYAGLGQLDSALFYARKSYELNRQNEDKKIMTIILNALGRIEVQSNHLVEAEQHFKQGLEISRHYHNLFSLVMFSNNLADLYHKTGRLDSCLLLAKSAFDLSQQNKYGLDLRTATRLLTETYEVLNQPDSSLKYLKLMMAANDSIFGQERVQQFQLVNFDEEQRKQQARTTELNYRSKIRLYAVLFVLGLFLLLAIFLFQKNKQKEKINALLQQQKDEIAHKNSSLEQTLAQLKTTQTQLIQSEKMASLGELTAGIAHEIQNPLNFVNNFSEINKELLEELKGERGKANGERNEQLEDQLVNSINENEEKIYQHGKRAEAIVKSMLQHSQLSSGQKEPTDLNALVDEYLRLSYHAFQAGLKEKDTGFNATIKTNYDQTIDSIQIIPQNVGRVLLNIFNNAFQSVTEKMKTVQLGLEYEPTLSVSTKKLDGKVEIAIKDNGVGIPHRILDKVFQPFFTTKPPGQGTGLGLSLSYDMVKAHGGELNVNTREGEYAEFIIMLPI